MIEPEPLPLEDAPARPEPTAYTPGRSWAFYVVWGFICVLLIPITWGVLQFRYYGHGLVMGQHQLDDGQVKVTLPGDVVASDWNPPPSFGGVTAGKRFNASSMFAHLKGSVGWLHLDADRLNLMRLEDLIAGVSQQRAYELKLTIVKTVPMKYVNHEGFEIHYEKDRNHWTEQYILVTGSQPRLYSVGAGGRDFPHDSPAVRKVIQSLQVK